MVFTCWWSKIESNTILRISKNKNNSVLILPLLTTKLLNEDDDYEDSGKKRWYYESLKPFKSTIVSNNPHIEPRQVAIWLMSLMDAPSKIERWIEWWIVYLLYNIYVNDRMRKNDRINIFCSWSMVSYVSYLDLFQ